VRDVDAALMQQVFDIPQRQWIPDNHHHRQADDLRRRLEVAKNAGVAHLVRLAALTVSDRPVFPLTVPCWKLGPVSATAACRQGVALTAGITWFRQFR
jgi:hypothetical protein